MSSFDVFLQQLEPVLITLAPIVVPILLSYLTLFVRSGFEKMPSNARGTLEYLVQTGVSAAEQTSFGKLSGPEKHEAAMAFIHDQLSHYKLQVPDSVIEPMLQEAVMLLNIAQGKAAAKYGAGKAETK